ncbi:MAG: hypothetical protein NDF55_06580 [archaeon GB-1867-005]|nr:hypothetical protein [Candidatus Culexmicrobium cathedralense]
MRRTRALDYIKRLLSHSGGVEAGEELLKLYFKWKETLDLKDFLVFIESIQSKWKDRIMQVLKGMPQMIGQFRAFSFEEYIVDLIRAKVDPEGMGFKILWNEKLLIWRYGDCEYWSALDVVVSRIEGAVNVPIVVVEAKIDVDAPRLRSTMLNFELLKRMYPEVRTVLAYLYWNADEVLKSMAKMFVDELFDFNFESQVSAFISFISSLLSK